MADLETTAQKEDWLKSKGWTHFENDPAHPVPSCWHDYNPAPDLPGREHRSFVFAYTTELSRQGASQ